MHHEDVASALLHVVCAVLFWQHRCFREDAEPVLELYCDHLDATYPKGTRRNRLSGLERAISVLEPEADRALFVQAKKRLGKVHPSPDKERRVQSTIDLEDLGDELMDLADTGRHRSPRLALQSRSRRRDSTTRRPSS